MANGMNPAGKGVCGASCGSGPIARECPICKEWPGEAPPTDRLAGRHLLLHRGDDLYRVGDAFHSLYLIRSGLIKTYFISEDGEEQILGFHMPGEIVGLDGIADAEFPSNATALDTTSICRLPLDALEAQPHMPALQRALLKGMSQAILCHENMLMLLGKKSADERVASFLLNRSNYQRRQGYSATAYTLAMTRTDMGKYLGLMLETVSRVLSRLRAQKVIAMHINQLEILDLEALRQLAGDYMGNRQGQVGREWERAKKREFYEAPSPTPRRASVPA